MAVTAAAVKELREKTGLPMMDCKKARARAPLAPILQLGLRLCLHSRRAAEG